MDSTLRCNKPNGACRTHLVDRAVVTTCCHIFCLRCADELGITRATADERSCPACNQHLPNTDDAVTTVLQPTEDYKTSVLSGLDPTTVMECAGRALAFWSYQTAQEIAYQEYLGKIMTDKYTHLSRGMDKVITDANTEIQSLQEKVMSMGVDYKSLQQKNNELIDLYKEKNRKHQQTQYLYDTLKKRYMMNSVQSAASQNVNQTLQSIESQTRPETYSGVPNTVAHGTSANRPRRPQMSQFDSGVERLHTHQRSGSASRHSSDIGAMAPPQMRPSQRSRNLTAGTPQHRAPLGQRIGSAGGDASRSQILSTVQRSSHAYSGSYPGSTQRISPATRQQFPTPGERSTSSVHGIHGIQAGMKVGAIPNGVSYIKRPASYAGDSFTTGDSQTGTYSRGKQPGGSVQYFH